MQPQHETTKNSPSNSKFKRRAGGMTWIFVGIAALFLAGLLMSMLRKQRPANSNTRSAANAEMNFGVQEFITADEGGVTFNHVYPPDSPADKAGLIGGDIVTSFDGHSVRGKDELVNLLQQTPVGKTVELVYLRDGDTKKTLLTTIPREQFELLGETFENRTMGYGALGFEDTVKKVVPVGGKNVAGVKLNVLSASGPAALAGIQTGDVVIEFDRVPIRNRGEFLMRVRRAIPYSTVTVVVVRGDKRLEIPVKMGKR